MSSNPNYKQSIIIDKRINITNPSQQNHQYPMGKKSKVLNEDPILKKNFKLEKRKKERQLEKQKIKQQQQAEEKRLQQLRLIQKKVQQDIQKYFEQQKLTLIQQASKSKYISKNNSFISAFKNTENSLLNQLKKNESSKSYQQQLIKNIPSFFIKTQGNTYNYHFAQQLPKAVNEVLTKQKKITQAMKMEQQIKAQINSMFSVQKVGEQTQTGNYTKQNWTEKINEKSREKSVEIDLEKALEEQEKEEQPYIIDRKGKTEREGLIGNQIFSLSKLGLQNLKESKKEEIQKMQDENQEVSESEKEYQIANQVISSYIDYIHMENKEQQTIEDFRKLIIKHMYQHQLQCLKALKENKKSKGFTNSKFLILTPYVGDAKAIFDIIEQEFMQDSQENPELQVQEPQKKKTRTVQWVIENKGKIEQNEDDEDDFFRVGIKILPKKKKVVYFSNFDSSDIIVASPIGLKSIISGESGKNEISFLSSVEVLYVDRASVIMMQNWDHLLDVFNSLNYMPKYESLKNSINEIREEFLELKGRVYRQNIVFSEFGFPELNSLKLNHFHNWQGTVTSRPVSSGVVLEKNEKVEKSFYKIELKEPKEDMESRFEYFKRKFWDRLHNNDQMKKVVIFVNSYFEFVKVKGFLEKVNASFEAISQHTKKQKIQSRVSLFNNNSYRILLLTERAYYFGLCQIKKHHHIFFYSLPRNSFIYKEMIENLHQNVEENSKIVCIYSKYDKFIVQRLVGTPKALEMIKEYCTNVSFIL